MNGKDERSPPATQNVVRLFGASAVIGVLMEITGYWVILDYAIALKAGGFILTALGCIGYFVVQSSSKPN